MSRFDRKVERQKSEFIFSKKVIPEKTKVEMIKENFSFKWIKINFKTVIYLIIDFIFVSIVFIPFLMQFYNAKLSFILGHALLTGFLVVLTFYFIDKEKPSLFELLVRYCFMAVILAITSFISGLLV
ncbi:hypothetical protein [Thomasclavelia cocleata]|uniref:hypothetical protein n=1 Tax=Thomasclavelia cocleata TaxID=69824 RepID=UPI00248BFBB7|nr:hypothetical protein [Thomasclavelia cocleata]